MNTRRQRLRAIRAARPRRHRGRRARACARPHALFAPRLGHGPETAGVVPWGRAGLHGARKGRHRGGDLATCVVSQKHVDGTYREAYLLITLCAEILHTQYTPYLPFPKFRA